MGPSADCDIEACLISAQSPSDQREEVPRCHRGSCVQARRQPHVLLARLAKDHANALVPHELEPIHACHKSILVLHWAKPSTALERCYIIRASAELEDSRHDDIDRVGFSGNPGLKYEANTYKKLPGNMRLGGTRMSSKKSRLTVAD